MSTQCNHYVILGASLPFLKGDEGDDQYEKFENFMDSAYKPKKSGLLCLYDGMNGEYILVGHVLASTKESGGFDRLMCMDAPDSELVEQIVDEIKTHFDIEVKKSDIKTYVTSHYR